MNQDAVDLIVMVRERDALAKRAEVTDALAEMAVEVTVMTDALAEMAVDMTRMDSIAETMIKKLTEMVDTNQMARMRREAAKNLLSWRK